VLAGIQGLRGGPAGSASVAALDLNATDSNGQLQIRWNRNAAPVRTGSNALLEIVDSGGQPRAIPLDEAHLRSGFFTYARQGERVDVALSMDEPNGRRAREGTTFLGKVPDRGEGDGALRKQRDDLTRENAKLQSDLKAAQERNAKLERSLNDATKRLQQQRRLKNQAAK
jgi:hypothetical protein